MRGRPVEAEERLRLAPIGRDVLRVYGRHWRLLVPLAVLVLLPQGVGDALVGVIEVDRIESVADVAKITTIPATAAINLGGEALYAGIVSAVVVHWRRGEPLPGVRRVAREIPVKRLIAIDLILAIGAGIGFALLVVPGVLFFTYFAISPALVEMRRELTVGDALALSIRLVRGNFWRVLALFVTVLVLTDTATTILESPLHGVEGEVVLNTAVHAALEPFQGLATVLLAAALLDLSGKSPQNP